MAWLEALGEKVSLLVKTEIAQDEFGAPVYSEEWTEVPGVLVGNVTTQDAVTDLDLEGKQIAYLLCIPKGDTHDWEHTEVMIRGRKYRTVGLTKDYIEEALPPLPWNKQIGVERYE